MRRYMTIIIAGLILTIGLSQMVPHESEGWHEQTLADGSDEFDLTFPQGGAKNTSAELSFRKGVQVLCASINFTPLADTLGNYPANVSIDVGDNVRPEWNFIGQGYGHWGEQTLFLDETDTQTFTFNNPDEGSTTMRLPKDCQVTSAVMEIEGISLQRNWGLRLSRSGGGGQYPWLYSSDSSFAPILEINASTGNYYIQPDALEGKDTYCTSQAPTFNYGTYTYLMGGGGTVHSFAWFNLSAIPIGAVVYNATLSINHPFTNVVGDTFSIYRVTEDWDEMLMTYNNMPSVDPTVHASLVFPNGQGGWRSWNITTLLPLWLGYDFPTNVTMDIGADTTSEFYHAGEFQTKTLTADLSSSLNTYLATAPPTYTDTYGNSFVDIPINVSSDQRGKVTLRNISIEYDMTVTIDETSTVSLPDELNDLIPPSGIGNVTIPIAVSSTSAGAVRIHDIDILFNGYPKQNNTLTAFSLDEDTKQRNLVNLSHYFQDDFLGSTELTYTIESNSLPQMVICTIEDGHWLAVDASTGDYNDNWYGTTEIVVSAKDDIGLITESNDFIINITSVNDEPLVGTESIPDLTLLEGGDSSSIDLISTQYFHDIEDDPLYFDFVWDPLGGGDWVSNVTQNYDNVTKKFTISAMGDWFGSGVLRIYCDDDDSFEYDQNPYQDIYVTVQNLNDDPPVWEPIPDLEIPEDSKLDDAMDLDTKVTDIDSSPVDIKFSVQENVNGSSIGVTIDKEHFLDIAALEKDFDGETTVTLRATDESGNFADTDFRISIIPSNDPPLVTLVHPANGSVMVTPSVELRWNASDAETPLDDLTYNVFLGTGGGFEQVATGIKEESFTTSGLMTGATYTWWVVPNDGTIDGMSTSGKFSFTINTSLGSTSTLLSPKPNSVLNKQEVMLQWTGKTQPGYSLSYDVLLDQGNVVPTTKVAEGITEKSLPLEDLTDKTTYSWTVVPKDSRGQGICKSGVWNFTIDTSVVLYGVEISVDVTELTLQQGEYTSIDVEITNTGRDIDRIVPNLDARVLSSTVTLESEDFELEFSSLQKRTLTLDILIPDNTPAMAYTITVGATSVGDGSSDTVDISVEVLPLQTEGDEKDSGLSNSSLLLIVLIVVLVVVLVVVLFYRQRKWIKEEEARREEEERKRKEEALRLARAMKAMRGQVLRPTGPVDATVLPPPGVGVPVGQIARPTDLPPLQLPRGSVPQGPQQPPAGPAQPPGQPSGPQPPGQPSGPQPPGQPSGPQSPGQASGPQPPGQASGPQPQQPGQAVGKGAGPQPPGEAATSPETPAPGPQVPKQDDISYTLPGDD